MVKLQQKIISFKGLVDDNYRSNLVNKFCQKKEINLTLLMVTQLTLKCLTVFERC